MVSSAASCFCGVTPAQSAPFTVKSASGRAALMSRALETTQISVHTPQSSTWKPFPATAPFSAASVQTYSHSAVEPEGRFFKGHHAACARLSDFRLKRPAGRIADAVRHGQKAPLAGIHVVFFMGIEGEDDLRIFRFGLLNACGDSGNDGAGLARCPARRRRNRVAYRRR